jgi:Bacterial regulatory proteins, gntR family
MPCRFVDNEHSTVCKVSLSSLDRIPQHVLTGGLAVGVGGGSKHRILSMRKAEIEPFGLRSHGDTVHQVTYRSIGTASSWAFGRQPRPAGTLRVSPNPKSKVRSESGIPPATRAGSRLLHPWIGTSIIGIMDLRIDWSDPMPLAEQVAAEIRRAIAEGEAGPGDRLPLAKDLASVLGVNKKRAFRVAQ